MRHTHPFGALSDTERSVSGDPICHLADVTFCDLAGLRALVALRDHLRAARRHLVLRNPSSTVAALTDFVCGESDLIEPHHERKDCRAAC